MRLTRLLFAGLLSFSLNAAPADGNFMFTQRDGKDYPFGTGGSPLIASTISSECRKFCVLLAKVALVWRIRGVWTGRQVDL
jgi:hypothetical protein